MYQTGTGIGTGNNGIANFGPSLNPPLMSTYDSRRITSSSYEETLEQKISREILNLQKQIEEKMITIQGVIVNLQRESGKHVDYNDGFYRKVKIADNSLDEVMKSIKNLTEQITYAKEMLEAIKVSQEISEGYKDSRKQTRNIMGSIPMSPPVYPPNGGWVYANGVVKNPLNSSVDDRYKNLEVQVSTQLKDSLKNLGGNF